MTDPKETDEIATVIEKERPSSTLDLDNGDPAWQQVVSLFRKHGMGDPPWRMRDTLVGWLWWARYGEELDRALSWRAMGNEVEKFNGVP